MNILTMYRYLIKNMKFYPSVTRFNFLLAIKEEFREKMNLTDEL